MMQAVLATDTQAPIAEENRMWLMEWLKEFARPIPLNADIIREIAAQFSAWVKAHDICVSLVNWRYVPDFQGASASASARRQETPQLQKGETEDGLLRWTIVEEKSGSLIISFASNHRDLKGKTIAVKAVSLQKEATLTPVTEDQVGAKVVFTAQERMRLTDETQLEIDFINKPEDEGNKLEYRT